MGRKPRDLSGQKFGLLTAMYPTERRDHRGSVYWHCVCECGNEIDVSAGALMDYKQYIKRCGGREYYSIVDVYRDNNKQRYMAIVVVEVILWIVLFLFPIISLICKEFM